MNSWTWSNPDMHSIFIVGVILIAAIIAVSFVVKLRNRRSKAERDLRAPLTGSGGSGGSAQARDGAHREVNG